jgi:outer membrane protein OmpA-like peptidoglycan-associated protein
VEALYKLMKKNKSMVIRIEGHVNGTGQKVFEQFLSEKRAKTVYDYLTKKGIEKERMSTIGYGADKMLYRTPQFEGQASANRRVEINVISIK